MKQMLKNVRINLAENYCIEIEIEQLFTPGLSFSF